MRHDHEGAGGGLWLALLHLACCGGPLLVLPLISAGASVSLAGVLAALPYLATAGAVLALGTLVFSFARRCPSCGRRGAWVHDLNHPRETGTPPTRRGDDHGKPRRGAGGVRYHGTTARRK